MSMLVEFRAVWGYRIYQAVLMRAGHGMSLKKLAGRGMGHLTDMAARLDGIGQFDAPASAPYAGSSGGFMAICWLL